MSDDAKKHLPGTGRGVLRMHSNAFGLCNAPATFQRMMERCMGEINLCHCLIYPDDIVIFSANVDDHIRRLDALFVQCLCAM